MVQEYSHIKEKVNSGTYLKDKEDNKILKTYMQAKESGLYGGLDYGIEGNGCSNKTLKKNCNLIKRCIEILDKPFHSINREDAIAFRDKLQKDKVNARRFKLINGESISYEKQMTFSSKQSLFGALKQFWAFYQEYSIKENNKTLPDLFNRLRLRKPRQTTNDIKWLTHEHIRHLNKILKDDDFKLWFCISIDSAGRPIEVANLRKSNFKQDGDKLYLRLPSIKGVSGRKYLNEVIYEKDYIKRKLNDYEEDEYLFNFIDFNNPFPFSPNCYDWEQEDFKKLNIKIKYWTNKVCGNRYTSYVFRKSSTMYWLKMSENNMVWVQKRLGHVEGSKAIKSYMDFQGVNAPKCINNLF